MHPELVGLRPATQSLESPGPGNLLVGLVDEVLQSICMHLARAYRAICSGCHACMHMPLSFSTHVDGLNFLPKVLSLTHSMCQYIIPLMSVGGSVGCVGCG